MVLMPAQCFACGLQFQPPFMDVVNSTNVNISNVGVTCPGCGGQASVVEGKMNVLHGGIEFLAGPRWSRELIEALRLQLERIVQNPPDDPVAAVQAVSPELSRAISSAVEDGLRSAGVKPTRKSRHQLALGVIGGILQLLNTDTDTMAHNLARAGTGIEWLLRHVASHGTLPPWAA